MTLNAAASTLLTAVANRIRGETPPLGRSFGNNPVDSRGGAVGQLAATVPTSTPATVTV